MNEVYEVCARLEREGYDQQAAMRWIDDRGSMHTYPRTDAVACPNASECMKFARERWPDMRRFIDSSSDLGGTIDGYAALVNGHIWCHADPDQAARLALAAALEADNAK